MQTTRDQLIDALVATYRELNTRVRPLEEAQLTAKAAATGTGAAASVHDIIARMRNDELRFAQALKERITGVPMPDIFEDDAPIIGTESENDTTVVLISQFGTARATTLTMLKGLSDDDWNTTVDEGKTIHDRVQELVASDKRQLERIMQQVAVK
jgi:hypothetical protein